MPLGSSKSPNASCFRGGDARRGFALLITITLLAFLVLLLVSLAALTRVETQVASNSQQLAQARQNALMALNIALGQLQKYAGPDQRVTGTADLAGTTGGGRVTNGGAISSSTGDKKYWDASSQSNGLTTVVEGTRYWTGVWGNFDPADPTTSGNGYEKTPRPVLLNWLVSGNEQATFSASAAGQISTPGAGFGINPTGSPVSTVKNVQPALSTATSATASLSFGGESSSPVVLLVGPKTAGTESRKVGSSTESAMERYVVAPLVPISAPGGSVPGLGSSATPSIGRYAYWVGDEGVKARLNLADPYSSATTPATDPLAKARLRTAPRSGAEVVANNDSNNSPLSDFATTSYANWSQATGSSVKALVMPQIGMLDSSNTLTPVVLGRHFNDFTTKSAGIEADAYNGGLKRDLTYYIEQTTLATWTGTDGQPAGKDRGVLPTNYSPAMNTLMTADKRVPKWDIIHSFYNLSTGTDGNGHTNKLTGDSSSDVVYIRPASATQMGIFPAVVQMRLLIGVTANSTATATTATPAVPSIPARTFRILVNPLIELANPYPVTLSAPGGVDLQIKNDLRISSGNALKIRDVSSGTDMTDLFGGNGPLAGTIFHLPAFTLPKGQAAVFYVSGTNLVSASGTTVNLTQMNGTPPNAAGLTFKDYIYRDYGWNPASQTSTKVRVNEYGGNSTVVCEFTVPGSSPTQLLQQIGGIDADRNPSQYYQVDFNPSVTTSPQNYPINIYAWQYNEPGDTSPYGTGSPIPGQGNTALRTLTDFNPRASYYRVTNFTVGAAPFVQYYMPTSQMLQDFNTGLVNLYWGRSTAAGTGSVSNTLLFDLPVKKTGASNDFPVMSLAALQHANLTAEDIPGSSTTAKAGSGYNDFTWEFGSNLTPASLPPGPGHQPAYALGNSYASVFLPREKTVFTPDNTNYPNQMDNWGSSINGSESSGRGNGTNSQVARNYYDISYLLNTAVWDGYFFSTIPQSGSAYQPVNPRLSLRADVVPANGSAVRDGAQAANYTLVNGAFNINSTSVDAWAALLAGMKNLPNIPGLGTNGTNASVVFPRTLWQSAAAVSPPTGTGTDSYSGYRQLTDSDVRSLAAAIVSQVRMRGPFVSVAQFVNRVLVKAGADTNGLGQSGALQRAIDTANLNVFSNAAASATNDKAAIPNRDDDNIITEAGMCGTYAIFADGANVGSPTQLQRSSSIPGWLTQADVLQAIGPVLSARSDTFVIRTYGDVLNPVTGSTTPDARAWCEAVVQRTPDYVDQADPALAVSANATAPSATNVTNRTFGRRFKVVSFRWLSPDDI